MMTMSVSTIVFHKATPDTWAAQPGGVGGQCPPHFWDQGGAGVTGGGPMKMIFASTADSFYPVLYK